MMCPRPFSASWRWVLHPWTAWRRLWRRIVFLSMLLHSLARVVSPEGQHGQHRICLGQSTTGARRPTLYLKPGAGDGGADAFEASRACCASLNTTNALFLLAINTCVGILFYEQTIEALSVPHQKAAKPLTTSSTIPYVSEKDRWSASAVCCGASPAADLVFHCNTIVRSACSFPVPSASPGACGDDKQRVVSGMHQAG